jgi:hypothetical protein
VLHVRHLLRPLVDQQHDDLHVGLIGQDGIGDLLEDNRLSGLGRRHDQAPLALPDRGDQVEDARRNVAILALQLKPLLGIARTKIVEPDAVLCLLGILAVDLLYLE